MIVNVRDGGVALEDIDTLTAFKVSAATADRLILDQTLGQAGRFDGEHAWISEAWLRRTAAGQPAEWAAGFEKMLAFARTKGWFDATVGAIRAHVDWRP